MDLNQLFKWTWITCCKCKFWSIRDVEACFGWVRDSDAWLKFSSSLLALCVPGWYTHKLAHMYHSRAAWLNFICYLYSFILLFFGTSDWFSYAIKITLGLPRPSSKDTFIPFPISVSLLIWNLKNSTVFFLSQGKCEYKKTPKCFSFMMTSPKTQNFS